MVHERRLKWLRADPTGFLDYCSAGGTRRPRNILLRARGLNSTASMASESRVNIPSCCQMGLHEETTQHPLGSVACFSGGWSGTRLKGFRKAQSYVLPINHRKETSDIKGQWPMLFPSVLTDHPSYPRKTIKPTFFGTPPRTQTRSQLLTQPPRRSRYNEAHESRRRRRPCPGSKRLCLESVFVQLHGF